jgi:tetratricopeptide (TPR) repeat protein
VPIVSFGLFWFLVVLVPSALLVVMDRGEPMAEHRVYLASCGLFLAAGLGLVWIAEQVAHGQRWIITRSLGIAAIFVILSLAGRTIIRNVIWSSPVALWAEAADQAPDHWLPALALGEALHEAGRHAEAVIELRRAVGLNPAEPAAYAKLGTCLLETDRPADAAQVFAALAAREPRSPEASNGLASLALVEQAPDRARAGFAQTLVYDPGNVQARRGLAAVAELERQPADALRLCREVAALDPATPDVEACIARNEAAVALAAAQRSAK